MGTEHNSELSAMNLQVSLEAGNTFTDWLNEYQLFKDYPAT
jgi:hypothetical protein